MSVITKIEFENENRVYYSGEVLRGRATLTLNEEKIVRGIYVRIYGFGHCKWEDVDNECQNIECNESYIDRRIYLVGSNESDSALGDTAVPAGTHTYRFECRLPVEIPSSLEMPCGSIKYIVNLGLVRPSWQIPTPDFPFTVIKPLDLSADPTIHEPLTKTVEQSFTSCGCWESNPLHMIGTLPKSGFVPNETIDIHVEVMNPSSEHISGILVHIIQLFYMRSCEGKLEESNVNKLISKMLDGVRIGGVKLIQGQIVVPDVPPSDTTTSNIIKSTYILRLTALPGPCQDKVILEFPIKIGTNSNRTSNTIPSAPSASELDSQPILFQPTKNASIQPVILGEAETYTSNNPPTYEEAIKLPLSKPAK